MTLEDFEKSLAAEQAERPAQHDLHDGRERKRRKRDHRKDPEDHYNHKHRHRDRPHDEKAHARRRKRRSRSQTPVSAPDRNGSPISSSKAPPDSGLKRDSWMEAPSALDIDLVQRNPHPRERPTSSFVSSAVDASLPSVRPHEPRRRSLQKVSEDLDTNSEAPREHTVNYKFGDSGAQWRMTKLKAVYRQAEETGDDVDKVAVERYGDLQTFDDAREEEIELGRRETYGKDYVGKICPSGELFQERKLDMDIRREQSPKNQSRYDDQQPSSDGRGVPPSEVMDENAPTPLMDQTALNKLKAQLMKAKLKNSPDVKALEEELSKAQDRLLGQRDPNTVVLGPMENRMLTGGRNGEVKAITNKRGLLSGKVEENEDMSIDDMVREERRTKGRPGGSGRQMAERIAKDGKFDNDLEYLDENATKLAKRVHKSEINLRSTAISDVQKMNRILDTCPLCHKDDTDSPPIAPVVSLATRVFLSLPTEPEISDGGACIVPLQHRQNLLECDDDEWEEIRNFQKSLTRMYHDQGRDVIFYENAALPQKHKHAAMEVVPLPYELGDTAPAFFKEAILTTDEEWTQHKKLIDTLAKAKNGMGKTAFRRSIAKEMPYFHVWFNIDGGLGHIVDDSNRWPRGDLFAREIIGGMLDVGPEIIKRQGRWTRGDNQRTEGFRKRWRKFDWTRILTES